MVLNPKTAAFSFRSCFVLLTFLLFNYSVFGQCPVPTNCTPGNAPASSFPFGMGIYNVTIGSGATGFTNATSGGASAGYQDYSCTHKATVLEGVAIPIAVATNPNANENVRVWLDLNNNGIFDNTSELIFSSLNAKNHTGTFTVPVSASVVKNTVLRLRVAADNFASPLPTPCFTPQYSQVEDYGITVVPNTNIPAVDFAVNNPITCSPTVQFQNLTQNGATTWLWDFGDGNTATSANPSHTYAATGTYTVKLTACNVNGCDSLTKTNYIIYHTNVPVAASCTPATLNYCCGFGITKVTFHTMVNPSQNGAAGYEDFTCSKSVTVQEGQTYPLAVETNPSNNQDTWVYIDYNNDGSFSSNELVFSKLSTINPTGLITISTGKTLDVPLRMRVISDATGSVVSGCMSPIQGQIEDYSIVITQPSIVFTSSFNNICNSLVQFTGIGPLSTVTWFWDFGDGTTSNLQNPQHIYTSNGIFHVKLKVCSIASCDSVIKENFIIINQPCPTYCIPASTNSSAFSINRVTLNTLDNISGSEPNGYGDYTLKTTSLTKGSFYTLAIAVNNNLGTTNKTIAWIDLNRDGDFTDSGENIANSNKNTFSKVVSIPATAAEGLTRLRILTLNDTLAATPCAVNLMQGEIEDYTIEILPVSQKPASYFSFKVNPCTGLNLQFADSSSNIPVNRLWNFGDSSSGSANYSSLQYPNHTFSGAGTYTIQLKTCNAFGCDSIQQSITVQATTAAVPISISCIPSNNASPKATYGITKVSLNTINNTTSGAADGYKDYTCSQYTTLELLNSYTLTVQTTPPPIIPGYYIQGQVKVWIDYNNDGYFFDVDDLVYHGLSQTMHSISIVPPLTAVLNQPLRMRVTNLTMMPNTSLVHTACTLPEYGEAEDYTITIVPYTDMPVAAFSQDALLGCGGPIQFRDTSSFFPTSWTWDFGDPASGSANISNLKNPSHTFSGPGTYDITLTACNANGCNTIMKTNYITVPANITMLPAVCKPQTMNSCCNKGIRSVSFGSMSNVTGNSTEGYQDYSCSINFTAIYYQIQTLSVYTFDPNETIKAWIDYNNNGIFETSELVMNRTSGSVFFNLPPHVVKGVYLRMRVMSDDPLYPILDPCDSVQYGQVEDYAIKVVDPPMASFTYEGTTVCTDSIYFTDTSIRNPTSWLWTFGDPTSGLADTSYLQNPTHYFANSGNYLVKLTICNADGCDTFSKNLFVGANANIHLTPACRPSAFIGISNTGIYEVQFGNIINQTTDTGNDYKNYSCDYSTTVIAGNTYAISISSSTINPQSIQVWIDYNNNGIFETMERVVSSVNSGMHTSQITIPVSASRNAFLRMRIISEYSLSPLPGPCDLRDSGETEDYAIMILDPTGIPESNFTNQISLFPNPNNGTFSLEIPTDFKGEFQLEVHNLIGQKVAVKNIKPTGEIHPINLRHLPKGVYLVRIFNAEFSTVKKLIIE